MIHGAPIPIQIVLCTLGSVSSILLKKFIFGHSPTCLMKLLALETPESNAAITTSCGLK